MPFEPNDLSELEELTEEHLGFSALSDGLGFAKAKGPHPATTKGQTPTAGSRAPGNPARNDRGLGATSAGPALPAKSNLPSMELDEEDEEQLPPRTPQTGTGAVAGGPIWSANSAAAKSAGTPVSSWGNMGGTMGGAVSSTPATSYPDGPQRPMPPSGGQGVFQGRPAMPGNNGPLPMARAYNNITPSGVHQNPALSAPRVAPAPSAAQVLAEPAAPQILRVLAFLLDALIILVPLAGAWMVSFRADAKAIFLMDPKQPLLLFSAIFAAYFLLSESFGGQSLGKMAFGLHVVEDDKYQKPTGLRYAALRMLLLVVGTGCAGLGLFASFWDAKRRPWQDRYSASIVRRKA